MKERIRQVMEDHRMTQKNFAEFIGISAASLSSIFSDRVKPTLATVLAITSKFPDVNMKWLVTGESDAETSNVSNLGNREDSDDRRSPSEEKVQMTDLFGDSVQDVNLKSRNNAASSRSAETADPRAQQMLRQPAILNRKITEIRVFFDDGTYETFNGIK